MANETKKKFEVLHGNVGVLLNGKLEFVSKGGIVELTLEDAILIEGADAAIQHLKPCDKSAWGPLGPIVSAGAAEIAKKSEPAK